MIKVLKLALGFGAMLFAVAYFIRSSVPAPAEALVLWGDSTYFAPSCLPDSVVEKRRQSPISTARAAHLRADPECVERGGFVQEGRSLAGLALQRAGLLKPLRPRWNRDGTWNW